MIGHGDLSALKPTKAGGPSHAIGDPAAWATGPCPNCGDPVQMLVVARAGNSPVWMRCPSCGLGLVKNADITSPPAVPLQLPDNLPPDVAALWAETRGCLGAGAPTGAAMLCRKVLFNVAVSHGLPAVGDNGRAPTFAQVIQHLDDEGYLASKTRPWVEAIKDTGNEANHGLDVVSYEVALKAAKSTELLLAIVYEAG